MVTGGNQGPVSPTTEIITGDIASFTSPCSKDFARIIFFADRSC
jgi:hypothetical protein